MIVHDVPRLTADLYLVIITVIIATLLSLIVTHTAAAAAVMDGLLVLIALAAAHVLRLKYIKEYDTLYVLGKIPLALTSFLLPLVIGGAGLVKSLLDHDYDRSDLRTLLVIYCFSAFIILHPLTPPLDQPLLRTRPVPDGSP